MTGQDSLYEEWQDNKDRPAWVQANRDAIAGATGKDVPRGRSAIGAWLEDHKGAVTSSLEEDN